MEQRRYLARRLLQVVIAHPGPAHVRQPEFQGTGQSRGVFGRVIGRRFVGPRGDEIRVLDPKATCTECGATGTVALVAREVDPLISRYCPSCWANVRGKYWTDKFKHTNADHDDPASMIELADFVKEKFREKVRVTASAMWEDRFETIQQMADSDRGLSNVQQEQSYRQMAAELLRQAPEMYGPMPEHVRAFVSQYTQPDA